MLQKRLKLFYLFIPCSLIVCFQAFSMVYRKINHSLTREYGDIPDFSLYYILICIVLYLVLCFVAYKVSIYPLRKDYKNGTLIQYKVQVTGKQYFEHVGKCFLVLAALPPYDKTQVSTEQFEQTAIGDWIVLSVSPNTHYFFDELGKYYVL